MGLPERALFNLERCPWGALYRVALGYAMLPCLAFVTGSSIAGWSVILWFAAVLVALVVFGAIRSRRVGLAVPIGSSVSPGAVGQVRSPLAPLGSVIANGEEWSARSASGQPLERGTPIRVIKVEGLTLTVEPDASSSKGT